MIQKRGRAALEAGLTLALACLLPCLARAGGTAGETPMNFLLLDAQARAAGLGGAYAALAKDASALHYNPGGLAFLDSNHVAFAHAELFQGARQDYAAVSLKGPLAGALGKGTGVGAMVNTLGIGDIQRTTLSNPRGDGLGRFGARDWALGAGLGAKAGGWAGAGAGVKVLRSEIGEFSATAAALDLGLLADLEKPLGVPAALGVSVQNLGTRLKYQSGREDLPLNLRLGGAYRLGKAALLALDMNLPKQGSATFHAGAEARPIKALALRLGYNGRAEADSGITLGGGFEWQKFAFDYAFLPLGDLGAAHRIGLGYRW